MKVRAAQGTIIPWHNDQMGNSPSKWLIRRVNSQCDTAIRSTIPVSNVMCSYLSFLTAGSAPSIFLLGFASERVLDLSLGKPWFSNLVDLLNLFQKEVSKGCETGNLRPELDLRPLKVKGTQKRRCQRCNLWCLQVIQSILTLPSDQKYTTLLIIFAHEFTFNESYIY
uniref:Uncharacterized protein n=1 Tax=Solanum lycopersicum TaxID=4081 RepID=K4DEB5_SOLLC